MKREFKLKGQKAGTIGVSPLLDDSVVISFSTPGINLAVSLGQKDAIAVARAIIEVAESLEPSTEIEGGGMPDEEDLK